MKPLLLILCGLVLVSCSGESEQEPAPVKEHVWKDMTDTIEKAKGIEPLIDDTAERQRRAIEAATQ